MLISAAAAIMAHGVVLACGSVVGFSLALTGGGGSTLAVPLLLFVVGVQDAHLAIGTSALAVSLNAYANLIPHARAGNVQWRAGILFTIAGVAGALLASELGKRVDGQALVGLFAVLMMVVATVMLRRCRAAAPNTDGGAVRYLNTRLMGTGLGAGTIAGFFGVGGGFVIVPGLMLASRMEIIQAIGTSLFGVGSFGLTTALNYARSGLVDWQLAGMFIVGGVAGGWGGTRAARHLAKTRGALNIVFASVLIVVAVYMLVKTLLPVFAA